MREFRPGAVLGVGGYASGPAMVAALGMKIPAMAYEPNAMPGLANRLVGKRVQAAAINFSASAKWFRNAEVTGVPVRAEFFRLRDAGGRAASARFRRIAGRADLQYTSPAHYRAVAQRGSRAYGAAPERDAQL